MVKFTSNRNGISINDRVGFYGHDGHITLQEYTKYGGVCGAISFFGTGAAQAFGLPAFPVGQPGHCAFLYQRTPGRWQLANDISGWAKSMHLNGAQGKTERSVWDVALMEQAQADWKAYSTSERLRTAATLAPAAQRGDVFARAVSACPFNLQAWEARVAHARLHNCNDDRWVAESLDVLSQQWFGKESVVISKGKPVDASDAAFEYMNSNLVDCGDTVWRLRQRCGWVDIDLGQLYLVSQVSIQWEHSPAISYKILASSSEAPTRPIEISRGASVRASEFQNMAQNITDGEGYGAGDTIWYAENRTAWVQIELKENCTVTGVHIQWWGKAVSSSFRILSSSDGVNFMLQRTQADALSLPNFLQGEINGWHGGIAGWSQPTRYVRFELADGHPDGWNHNKLYGIRNICVKGYTGLRKPDANTAFVEVQTDSNSTNNGICSVIRGWRTPTRFVRLHFTDTGREGFGVRQLNVHGGAVSQPTTAIDVLKAEAAYQLNQETVCAKYYGGDPAALKTGLCSQSSSGKDRPLILAVEYIHSLLDSPLGGLPLEFTPAERTCWLEKGFEASVEDKLLILSNASTHGANFRPSRAMSFYSGCGGWAEYSVYLEPGEYRLFTYHTAADPRPLQMSLDGVLCGDIASQWNAGSKWSPATMSWFHQALILRVDGACPHVIRFHASGCWPHISSILFSCANQPTCMQPAASDSVWVCERCTFSNHGALRHCEMCDAVQPEVLKSDAPGVNKVAQPTQHASRTEAASIPPQRPPPPGHASIPPPPPMPQPTSSGGGSACNMSQSVLHAAPAPTPAPPLGTAHEDSERQCSDCSVQ